MSLLPRRNTQKASLTASMGRKGRGWLSIVGEDRKKAALVEMEEMIGGIGQPLLLC